MVETQTLRKLAERLKEMGFSKETVFPILVILEDNELKMLNLIQLIESNQQITKQNIWQEIKSLI